jgi:hypothetical protein
VVDDPAELPEAVDVDEDRLAAVVLVEHAAQGQDERPGAVAGSLREVARGQLDVLGHVDAVDQDLDADLMVRRPPRVPCAGVDRGRVAVAA